MSRGPIVDKIKITYGYCKRPQYTHSSTTRKCVLSLLPSDEDPDRSKENPERGLDLGETASGGPYWGPGGERPPIWLPGGLFAWNAPKWACWQFFKGVLALIKCLDTFSLSWHQKR